MKRSMKTAPTKHVPRRTPSRNVKTQHLASRESDGRSRTRWEYQQIGKTAQWVAVIDDITLIVAPRGSYFVGIVKGPDVIFPWPNLRRDVRALKREMVRKSIAFYKRRVGLKSEVTP